MELIEGCCRQLHLDYISDIRFLGHRQQRELAKIIESIPHEKYSLSEWNDAVEYILRGLPEPSALQAKQKLIQGLKV